MRKLGLALVLAVSAVSMPLGALAEDSTKAQQIATALEQSGKLKDYNVGVRYSRGTALLEGTVLDRGQMAAAIEVAKSQPYVENVINRIEFAPGQPAAQPASHTAQVNPRAQARPAPRGAARPVAYNAQQMAAGGRGPQPAFVPGAGGGVARANFDQPHMPGYAWPSYAAHPNYAALTYPKQYSPTAWPYIGPFYPYPQVPLGWRKVTLEWDDGWWMLDFKN